MTIYTEKIDIIWDLQMLIYRNPGGVISKNGYAIQSGIFIRRCRFEKLKMESGGRYESFTENSPFSDFIPRIQHRKLLAHLQPGVAARADDFVCAAGIMSWHACRQPV